MTVFEYLNKWFRANSFSLNFEKTHLIQFTIKNGPQINMDISYGNKTIFKAHDTKFLGLSIDSTLSWKLHIGQVLHILSAACYALRSIKPYVSGSNVNGLLCLLSLRYVIWNNILGKLYI
jgi:hypothetical protein